MKKNILNIGMVLIIGLMLLGLTGCKEKNENNINDITTSDISNEENNNIDNNQQNSINNETNIVNNNIQESNSKKETNTSKNENQQVTTDKEKNTSKNENQQVNTKKETNTSKNESQPDDTKKDTPEKTQKKTTFNVGNYVLHYGKYSGSGSKLIDTSIASATITINLKEDGTYTYTSTNQEVSKNRSGTYKIKSNYIVLNDSEPLEYIVMNDDYLVERQGSGFSFSYQEN